MIFSHKPIKCSQLFINKHPLQAQEIQTVNVNNHISESARQKDPWHVVIIYNLSIKIQFKASIFQDNSLCMPTSLVLRNIS